MSFFADPEVLPDELLPFSGKLSPRFYEIRKKIAAFCLEVHSSQARPPPSLPFCGRLPALAPARGAGRGLLHTAAAATVCAPRLGSRAPVLSPPPGLLAALSSRRSRPSRSRAN